MVLRMKGAFFSERLEHRLEADESALAFPLNYHRPCHLEGLWFAAIVAIWPDR